MAVCKILFDIQGAPATGSNPVFFQLVVDGIAYSNPGADIGIYERAELAAFLNKLGIGGFIVTVSPTFSGGTLITFLNGDSTKNYSFIYQNDVSNETIDGDAEDCTDAGESTACFDNLLGVRDLCEPVAGDFSYYLDDFEINSTTLDAIRTTDFASARDFFLKKKDAAVQLVSEDIYNHLSPNFRAASIMEGMRLGYYHENKTLKTSDFQYSGIKLQLLNCTSYMSFYVSEISLFLDYSGVVPVFVYDYLTGQIIDTINVTCIAGEVSKAEVHKLYRFKRNDLRLAFLYDTTGIDFYKSTIRKSSCCGNYITGSYVKATGAYSDANTFTDSDLKSSAYTHGMQLVYSISCDHKSWLCSHLNSFALPIAYKTAALIMQHGIMLSKSQRVNTSVTINSEQLEKNLEHYNARYAEQMNVKINNMRLPSDKACFACKEPVKIVHVIP